MQKSAVIWLHNRYHRGAVFQQCTCFFRIRQTVLNFETSDQSSDALRIVRSSYRHLLLSVSELDWRVLHMKKDAMIDLETGDNN